MGTHDFGKAWHEKQLGTVDDEIAKLSFICGIPLLDPGVVERVLGVDETGKILDLIRERLRERFELGGKG
jgi:hypothetical protein